MAEVSLAQRLEQLEYDLGDIIHLGTTHPESVVCHGDNDGCEGGPSDLDYDLAAKAMEYVRAAVES